MSPLKAGIATNVLKTDTDAVASMTKPLYSTVNQLSRRIVAPPGIAKNLSS